MAIAQINVAVVGCGVISDIYLQSLQDKFAVTNVVACSDLNPEKMQAKAEKYHIKAMNYADILADPTIQLIVNLTTPKAHYSIIKQALEHGKHVFSEKMIAVELSDGQELCELARSKNLRLGVAPDTFLGGGIQTARYMVDHGLIGDPLSVVVSLNRNFRVYADIFPHMNQRGGTLPFDTGCYYLTALASILGPAKSVSAFGRRYQPERIGQRTDKPWFGEKSTVEADNILKMGDPNNFDSPNYLTKQLNEPVKFPFTHGFLENSRGLGVADMAWAIQQNRPHRASMEMAYHVFELIHGMYQSAETETVYHMQSTFDRPQPLPTGYLDNGFWGPTEESALAF